ncbi:MAG TPA: arylesterase [Gemmatimonadaceae bacterium]
MRVRITVMAMALMLLASACSRGDAPAHVAAQGDNTASAPARARPARASAQPTILFVGTSLTAGYGLADPDDAYPEVIARRIDSLGLNYRVVNAGVSGETSAGALRRMSWLMRGPVNVFVLETGANDGLRGLSVDSMRANIQAIFDSVRAAHPDAKLVLLGMKAPPNMGPSYTRAFDAAFPALARRNDATFVPFLLAGVAGVDSLNQGDGIHPNVRGAELVADNVWRVLRGVLQTRTALDPHRTHG